MIACFAYEQTALYGEKNLVLRVGDVDFSSDSAT